MQRAALQTDATLKHATVAASAAQCWARSQSICGAVSGLDASAVHAGKGYASRIRPSLGGTHAGWECVAHEAWHQSICGAMILVTHQRCETMKQQSVAVVRARMWRAQQKLGSNAVSTEHQTRPQSICGAVSGLHASAVHAGKGYASRIRPARGGTMPGLSAQ